jgi:bla regulator protein blaR1
MDLLNNSIIISLSWTLLHSLWQGGLIALCIVLLFHISINLKPVNKYGILVISMFFFFAATVYTFLSYFSKKEIETTGILNTTYNTQTGQLDQVIATIQSTDFISILNQNIYIIFTLWAVFFLFKLLKFLLQIRQISRLRSQGLTPLPKNWNDKVLSLSSAFGMKTAFDVLQSSRVKAPSVIGFLKPIILLPIGVINGLPSDQIEAILLHEMAHIKRNDFVMNLIQRIGELFFFFNPGFMWLSNSLDNEREHSCDEMALEIHKDKESFVNALIVFNEMLLVQNNLTLGFGSNKNYLLGRAKRILYNQDAGLAIIDKSMLIICLIFTSMPFLNYAYQSSVEHRDQICQTGQQHSSLDTLPPLTTSKAFILNEMSRLNKMSDSLQQLNINGEGKLNILKECEDKLLLLQGKLNMLNEGKLVDLEKMSVEEEVVLKNEVLLLNEQKLELKEESLKLEAEAKALKVEAESLQIQNELYINDAKSISEESKKMKLDAEKMELEAIQHQLESKKMQEESKRMQEESKRMQEESKKMQEESKLMQEESKRRQHELRSDASHLNAKTQRTNRTQAESNQDEQNIDRKVNGILDQLVKDNIISSKKDLSFSISKNEMIVNGVKQNGAIAKKYFEAFGIKGGSIVHNFKITTSKN